MKKFAKTLDKSLLVCYNKYIKRGKELIKMLNEEELRKMEIIIEKCQSYSALCHSCTFYKRCFFGFECLSSDYSCYKEAKTK